MKNFNFLSKSSSRSCGHSSVTLASTVGSPSAHRRGTMLKLLSVLVLIFTFGIGQMWGAGAVSMSTTAKTFPAGSTSPSANAWKNAGAPDSYPTSATDYTINSNGSWTLYNAADYGNADGLQLKASGGYIQTTISSSAGVDIVVGYKVGNNNIKLTLTGATDDVTGSSTSATTASISTTSTSATFKILKEGKGAGYIKYITITPKASSKTLSSISVQTAPTKKKYIAGETFDPTGLIITRNYSSGSPDTYTYASHTSEFSFTPSTSTALTTSNTSVSITYGGKSTSQAINVYNVTMQARDEDGNTIPSGGPGAPTRTGNSISPAADANNYVFKEWQVTNASLGSGATTKSNTITNPTGAVTVTAVYHKPITITYKANGQDFTTQTYGHGGTLAFPASGPNGDTYSCTGKTFTGWVAEENKDYKHASTAPTYVTAGGSVTAAVTYYAVFANVSGGNVTKTYGFEATEADASYWTIGTQPSQSSNYHNSGSYSGYINTNNTYVTFKNKVKVTAFSFYFTRTSNNNNYNVYIETSTDGSSWSAAQTFAMSSFATSVSWSKCEKTWDGSTAYYVRFHCSNTTAVRYVDDISITYSDATYSNYETNCCTPLGSVSGTISSNSPTSVTLSWSAVTGAEKYQVKVPGSSSHNDWTDVNATSVTVTKSCGTAYTAYFKAVDTNGSHCSEGPESTLAIPAQSWTVTSTGVTNVTASPAIPSTTCSGFNTTITAATGYALPSEITVTNADKTWNSSTGALTISNVTGNVTITIAGTCVAPDITVHPASANYVADPVAAATALSVTASAAGADLDYQWQSKVGEGDWTDISVQDGGTAATYTPSRTTAGVTQYRVVLTNHTCSESSNSNAATITVTVPSVCIAPTFDPEEGTYTGTQSVVLASETTGATVYYTMTTDGSEPATPTSGSTAYSSAISVTENTHIKAIAIKDGMQASSVAEAEYIIKCETPAISPAAGTYTGTKSVTITCATDDATIYYTTDGSTPDNTKTEYTGAFDVANNQTVKAIAIKSNMANSAVASAAYLIKCETPAISPAAGTHTGAQDVTITCATDGATIYYTTDGSTPDNTKTEYTGSFKVTNSKTVKAIAIKSGMENSAIASAAYTIQHTITWSANGSTTTTTVTDGNKLVLPVSAPTSCNTDDYGTFIGWYSTAAGSAEDPSDAVSGTKADADHTPTGDETYYAVWGNGELVGGWQKVTSIAVGDVVIFVQETASKEMSNIALINTNMCGIATAYSTSPAGTYPLTIETGNGGSGYSFKTSANTYLSWSSNNTLTTSDTKNNASSWTISTSTDGNFKFANVETTERIMQFNNNSGQHRWACYGNDNQTAFQIYKQAAGATGFISSCCEEWTATAKYGESNVINVNDVVAVTVTGTVHGTASYESDDTDVLTVTSDGKITGKKAGSATVTISWAGADGYCAYETTVDVTVNGTITVTYNKNDGSLSPATTSQNATSNSAFTLDANSFSRTGYTFQGWATTPSGDKEYNNSQADVEFAEDITLYAVWSINSHAVTLTQPTGNTIEATGAANLASVAYGTSITLSATENDGYVFTGWSATGVSLANTNPVVFLMPDNDVTVTATYSTYSWIAADPRYTVTTAPKISYTKVEKFSTAGVVIKENFMRDDDNTITKQETYAGAWTAKLNGVAIANGADLSLDDNGKTLKLYIGEEEIASYTLTVNNIDVDQFVVGIWDIEAPSFQINTYTMPTLSDQTAGDAATCKDHNIFIGWTTDPDDPKDANIIAGGTEGIVASNTTYYAVWAKMGNVTKTLSYGWEDTESSTGLNITMTTSNTEGGARTGSKFASAASGQIVKTSSSYASPKSITYYIKKQTTNTNSNNYFVLQYSANGSSWTDIDATKRTLAQLSQTDWTEISLNLSAETYQNKYFRVYYTTGGAAGSLDDFSFTYETTGPTDYIVDCEARYEIRFDANGATGSYDPIKKAADKTIELPSGSMLSKEYHNFAGWKIGAVAYEAGDTYTVAGEDAVENIITVMAQWSPFSQGAVTVDGEALEGSPFYATQSYTLPTPDAISGKRFIGWSDGEHIVAPGEYAMPDPAVPITYTSQWFDLLPTPSSVSFTDGEWILVTAQDHLHAGDFIVVAAANADYAMGAEASGGNNRTPQAVTKSGNTLSYTSDVQPLFLQNGYGANQYALYDMSADKYLYAASSGNNYLKIDEDFDENGSWLITIANGSTSVMAQGDNTHNDLRYNAGNSVANSVFSCYVEGGQLPIALYRWIETIKTEGNVSASDVMPTYNVNLVVQTNTSIDMDVERTVNDFYIEAMEGESGQVKNPENLNINGNAYYDLTLNASGTMDNSKWYAFAVPFQIDAATGIQRLSNDGKTSNAGFNSHYRLLKYNSSLRASSEDHNGWEYITKGETLEPGKFYMIAMNSNEYNRVRMTKKAGEDINNAGNIPFTITGTGLQDNWNALANNALYYANVGVTGASNSGVEKVQVYNPIAKSYNPLGFGDVTFTVGTPFFIQVAGEGNMTIVAAGSSVHDALHAPTYRTESAEEFQLRLGADTESYYDQLYVSASDEALNSYQIGHDLAKAGVSTTIPQMYIEAYGGKLCDAEFPLVNREATFPLTFTSPSAGTYQLYLVAAPENADLYLQHNGVVVWDLKLGAYALELTSGTNTEYSLLLQMKSETPTGIEDSVFSDQSSAVQKVIIDEKVYILRGEQLFDVTGKTIR